MPQDREMGFTVKEIPKATMIVTVDFSRGFRFRLWLALRLIWLANWILGWRLEYEGMEESGEQEV